MLVVRVKNNRQYRGNVAGRSAIEGIDDFRNLSYQTK
jgi:hypothetical protein